MLTFKFLFITWDAELRLSVMIWVESGGFQTVLKALKK